MPFGPAEYRSERASASSPGQKEIGPSRTFQESSDFYLPEPQKIPLALPKKRPLILWLAIALLLGGLIALLLVGLDSV